MGKSNKKLTSSDILAKCRKAHGNRYSYPDGCDTHGGNADTKIRILCQEHGEFQQSARAHIRGQKCPKCALKERSEKRKISGEELRKRFIAGGNKVHGGKYKYLKEHFIDKAARNKVTIICHEHGPFEQTYASHIVDGQGCRKCSHERIFSEENKSRRRDAVATPVERRREFLRAAKLHHGTTYTYPLLQQELVKECSEITVICPECGPFKQLAYIHARGHGCRSCCRSTVERAIERFVRKILPTGEEIRTSDRKTIKPYELDIYVPSRNVAIEYGAVVWHSEDAKGLRYHALKQQKCQDKGITLLTFFDADWNDLSKRKIIKGRIKSALGLVTKSVYARKCLVTAISNQQAKSFLNSNHIQGYRPAKLHLGLFEVSSDALVSVASFGKPRFSKNHEWELIRLASKRGVSVVGGLSKMLAHFARFEEPKSMVSYADLRWGTGKSYERAGFRFSHRTTPARWYAHKAGGEGRLIHRMAVQRHQLPDLLGERFNPDLSASANLRENGYLAIGDCGNNVYTWQPPTPLKPSTKETTQ